MRQINEGAMIMSQFDRTITVDGQTYSEDEAWDWWLRREVIDELCTALGVASLDEAPRTPEFRDDSRDIDDIVREVYYSFEGNEWVCETANSAINLRHDDAVQHVLNTVFATES